MKPAQGVATPYTLPGLALQRLHSRSTLQTLQPELSDGQGQDRSSLLPDVDQAALYAAWAEAALLCLR